MRKAEAKALAQQAELDAGTKKRPKCNKRGACAALSRSVSEPNRKGLAFVQVAGLSTGVIRIAGLAFKKTEADGGIFCNFCPFCGVPQFPLFKKGS